MNVEVLGLFGWQFLAGVAAAFFLSLRGAQVSSRRQTIQVMVSSQASVFFGLLSWGIVSLLTLNDQPQSLSLIGALVGGVGTWIYFNRKPSFTGVSVSASQLSVYVLFVAASYGLSVFFPQLESHFKSLFFGDLATISNSQAVFYSLFTIFCGVLEYRYRLSFTKFSFLQSVFHRQQTSTLRCPIVFYDSIVSVAIIILSVQFLGLIFTLGFLLLPSVVLRSKAFQGLNRHLLYCGLISVFSLVIGFVIALQSTDFPSVPLILIVLYGFLYLASILGHKPGLA